MRIQKRLMSSALMLASLGLGASAYAQQTPQGKSQQKVEEMIVIERTLAGQDQGEGVRMPFPPPPPGVDDKTFVFISTEMSLSNKVVKGAPYSAQSVTETTRMLGNGNRIVHKNSAAVYRDSEGRVRRDQELGSIGPWAAAGQPSQTVFINDPVAGVNYVLDPRTHTARKLSLPRFFTRPGEAPPAGGPEKNVWMAVPPPPGPAPMRGPGPMIDRVVTQEFPRQPGRKPQTESLGKQMIEGVEAEGTRTTVVIPAGEIGNEQPIEIVTEKWYSPELQTVVLSKHLDPLVGDTVFRLTNINRSEPARTLFEVPADYTIKEAPANSRVIRRKPGEEK
ncbi:MAG TPA: hypothetical protein VF723_01130 [Pyrinomonadaceae bacterium]|jgi:hypothetical protein